MTHFLENSNNYIRASVFIGSILVLTIVSFHWNILKVPLVIHSEASFVADFSRDEILVGASHNVFIGKVLRQVSTKDLGIGPETQYEVAIIDNIKGELVGSVTVNQQGGYKNGILHAIGSESNEIATSDYLLKPGATYLLATRFNSMENWHTLNSYPTARKLLSADADATAAALKVLATADTRVQALKAAYPSEVLLDADVKTGNARNGYISVKDAPPIPAPESKVVTERQAIIQQATDTTESPPQASSETEAASTTVE